MNPPFDFSPIDYWTPELQDLPEPLGFEDAKRAHIAALEEFAMGLWPYPLAPPRCIRGTKHHGEPPCWDDDRIVNAAWGGAPQPPTAAPRPPNAAPQPPNVAHEPMSAEVVHHRLNEACNDKGAEVSSAAGRGRSRKPSCPPCLVGLGA